MFDLFLFRFVVASVEDVSFFEPGVVFDGHLRRHFLQVFLCFGRFLFLESLGLVLVRVNNTNFGIKFTEKIEMHVVGTAENELIAVSQLNKLQKSYLLEESIYLSSDWPLFIQLIFY